MGGMMSFPDYPSEVWCERCFKTNKSCFYCSRPAAANELLRLDGTNVACKRCRNSAVSGQEEYEKLVDEIHPQIESILGRKFTRLPIRLVTPSEMTALAGSLKGTMLDPKADPYASKEVGDESEKPASGKGVAFLTPIEPPAMQVGGNERKSGHNLGLYIQSTGKREIALLDNLPSDVAWETISHELTHAWQNEHFPGNNDFFMVEGFAQLIARKICLRNYRSTRLNSIAERDDPYGHAYRVMHLFESEQGLEGIIKAFEARQLPPEFRTNSTTPFKEKEFIGTITIN